MRIHLPRHWQRKLANLPETSMGAQHVDIILRDGRVIHDVTVFNGEDCEVQESIDPKQIAEIRIHKKYAD